MENLAEQVLAILKLGRERIANGWCKRTFIMFDANTGKHCYCAMGALGYKHISQYSPNYSTAVNPKKTAALALKRNLSEEALQKFGREFIEDAESIVPLWNNLPETTQEDVIALFDKTIASLEYIAEPDAYVVSEPRHKHLTSAEKVQLALKGEI